MHNVPNTEEHPQQEALGNYHILILSVLVWRCLYICLQPFELKTYDVVLISLAYFAEAALLRSEGWDMQKLLRADEMIMISTAYITGGAALFLGRPKLRGLTMQQMGVAFLCSISKLRGLTLRKVLIITQAYSPNTIFNPNLDDEEKWTALMYASAYENTTSMAELLSDVRTDPNLQNKDSDTALMLAAGIGNTEAIKLLLADARTNPNITNQDESTALVLASSSGHIEAVEKLLADSRIDLNIANNGCRALLKASYGGYTAVVNALLAGAINKESALIQASKHGCADIIRNLLADKHIHPNLLHKVGRSALYHALKGNHNLVIDMLINNSGVIKTVNESNITGLLTKKTSDAILKSIISAKPSLAFSILSHKFVDNKSKTELLKHCENIDFFATETDGCHTITRMISANASLFEMNLVPKAFTQTSFKPALYLKVLERAFGVDSLVEFEALIQTWSPTLRLQKIGFFQLLSEKCKAELITYIHKWYTLFTTARRISANSLLEGTEDFSRVTAYVKTNHNGNWAELFAPHRALTMLLGTLDIRAYESDVHDFFDNLERSYYKKVYTLDYKTTTFSWAIQDHYKILRQNVQQAGDRIQSKYIQMARDDIMNYLTKQYPLFLERNRDPTYIFVEREEEPPIYGQIVHTTPEQSKVIDINLDLKTYTIQTPKKIPHVFTQNGALTELLSLFTLLGNGDTLSEGIGKSTLSCLQTGYRQMYKKDLPITLIDIQNLLKDLQHNPQKTKSSCLLWACHQSQPSQVSRLGLFMPEEHTASRSNAAAIGGAATVDTVEQIAVRGESGCITIDEIIEDGFDDDSAMISDAKKPSLDLKKERIIKDIHLTKANLSLCLSDNETIQDFSKQEYLLLQRLDQILQKLETALDELYHESFNCRHSLEELLLAHQEILKEANRVSEAKNQKYAAMLSMWFDMVQEHYKQTTEFIKLQITLQLQPSKISEQSVYSTPRPTEYVTTHSNNTILDQCLGTNILRLRNQVNEDNVIPLLDFLKETYHLVRKLRTKDIAAENKQKSFEYIADHLLYFTPLEACLNPKIPSTEITQQITHGLLTHQHSQQNREAATSNTALLLRLLIGIPEDLLGNKNVLFLLFCLHDCTKAHRPQPQVGSAADKLRIIRNTFCHPKRQESTAKTNLNIAEIQELKSYFTDQLYYKNTMIPGR